MNELSSLFWLLILLAFIVFMFIYGQARLRVREYKRGKRKLLALGENLRKLKENIASESDRWPMYARPVLFTEIDREAQIEFARAQQLLSEADQILPELEALEEPETPEQFSLIDFLNIPENLRTIFLGNQLIGNVSALEQKILHLQESLKSLRGNRQQVEKKRLTVEKSIEELRNRTEQMHKRLRSLDVWKSIEAHNFSWVINIADRCELEASNRIMALSETDQGYIEHAAADVFVNIGNFSLDCIELFLESQKISRRYELDTFFELFNESTGFLQSILGMEGVWSGWKKLKQVKPYIDALPITRQQAETSLRRFVNRQEYFEKLLEQINGIDVDKEIQAVDALEKECTYYWYAYAERKTYWEKALGNPVKFPSQELYQFQALLLGEILPAIHVDKVIQQSQLFDLIKKVGEALVWHHAIRKLAVQLATELRTHKEAHRIVSQLLDSQGEASRLFDRLRRALVDTSPERTGEGTRLVRGYRNYSEQARQVRGVDFPELLNSLNQWVSETERLVTEHDLQLEELKASYDTYYEQIGLSIKEIGVYLNYVPPFDRETIESFDEIFDEGIALLGERKVERYSWLRAAVDKMQAWSEKSEAILPAARDKYNAFEAGNRQVEELLELVETEITFSRDKLESQWGWYKREILPRLDSLARAFIRERAHWQQLAERNWAEYNIHRAVATCQNLIKFCEGVVIDLTQAMDQVDQKQDQLDVKVQAVMLLLDQNGSQLPAADRQDIRSLVGIAREYPNYDLANRVLGYAHTMAMRQATPRTREEVTNILQSHSRGGAVFLDQDQSR